MTKKILLLLLLACSAKAFSQEHWEDNFWREEAKKRYEKTASMAGLYTTFYSNGKVKWQGKCLENGTPDSTWVYYDDDGNKLWEGEYNGKYVEYQACTVYSGDGESSVADYSYWDTLYTGYYKNGLKDGEWCEYNYLGKFIWKKGHFRNGEPTGIWQEFAEETVVTAVMKTAEYDYATQKRTLYKKDSIDGVSRIDSLQYANQYGFDASRPASYNTTSSYINVLCPSTVLHYVDLSKLNDFYFQKGYSQLETPLQSFGIEWSGTEDRFYWHYNLGWTPAISAQLNDSIRLRLSGWNTNLFFGGDLIGSKAIDLCPAGGLGYQSLRLKTLKLYNQDSTAYSFGEGDYRVYKRFAFTPSAMLCLRINLDFFTIAVIGGYQFDISSRMWRYNGKYLGDAPKTDLSCPFIGASIGIHVPNE